MTLGTEDKELLKTRNSSESLGIHNTVRFTSFLRANYGSSHLLISEEYSFHLLAISLALA